MSDVWISMIVVLYGSFAEAIYHLAWQGFIYICICRKLEFPSSVETLHQNPLLDHLFLDRSCDSLRCLSPDQFPKAYNSCCQGQRKSWLRFDYKGPHVTCYLGYKTVPEDCIFPWARIAFGYPELEVICDLGLEDSQSHSQPATQSQLPHGIIHTRMPKACVDSRKFSRDSEEAQHRFLP